MLSHMNKNGVARTRSRHELARYFQQWEMCRERTCQSPCRRGHISATTWSCGPIRHQGWNEGCIHVIYHPYPPYERLRGGGMPWSCLSATLCFDGIASDHAYSPLLRHEILECLSHISSPTDAVKTNHMLNDQLRKGYPTSYSEKHSNQEVQNESTFWSDFFDIFLQTATLPMPKTSLLLSYQPKLFSKRLKTIPIALFWSWFLRVVWDVKYRFLNFLYTTERCTDSPKIRVKRSCNFPISLFIAPFDAPGPLY